MPLDSARWDKLMALFHGALELPAAERAHFIERVAAGDADLAAEALALLDEDATARDLVLDRDLSRVARDVLDRSVPTPGELGPYRIVGVLGQGGMGDVYLAQRDDLHSRAAIKILRDGRLSPARRERFEGEQRTLARLNHPSIARLYDAATLPDGTPYFVMELVEGMAITEYCASRRCTVGERLRLFRGVCVAVQHAHRHAIIHRDLKPSNIFVTESATGEAPAVKLLDFGIAEQIEGFEPGAVRLHAGPGPMTPAYAAPEQLLGEPVGVYTDVYALGVLLHELLAGEQPCAVGALARAEGEALPGQREGPSARVRGANRLAGIAPDAVSLTGQAWADLDAICLTAMQQDPQQRYATVEALLRDLDHYARGEPLDARPASIMYRAGKFLRRNRAPVFAASAVLALLIGVMSFHTVRLAAARDAALAEATRAQRIQGFMLGLFEAGGGGAAPADSLRVITLLEQGARDARLLESEPEVQAELYETLGTLFQELGDFARADSLLQLALEQRRSTFGAAHPAAASSLVALGLLRAEQGELEEAERLVREAVELGRRSTPPEHPVVAGAMTALGKVLQQRGEYQQAIELLEDAVRLHAGRGPATLELSKSLNQLANTHFYAGHYATSDSLNRLVLTIDRRLHGDRHPSVANALINLGAARHQLGYLEDAERLYRQAFEIKLGYHGPEHHQTAAAMMMLGQILTYLERYDEAIELLRPALAVRERVYGSDHPRVANTLNELGSLALRTGDLATAEENFSRMVDIYRRAYGDHHYLVGIALSNLGSVHLEAGELERAEHSLHEAVDQFRTALSDDHVNTAIGRIKLGEVLSRRGRYVDARLHLQAGYAVLVAQLNPSARWLQTAREQLAAVHDALGDTEAAERFRAELTESED
jgi:eukaryotic-like serine/threonine-protein kinase